MIKVIIIIIIIITGKVETAYLRPALYILMQKAVTQYVPSSQKVFDTTVNNKCFVSDTVLFWELAKLL
jgi:hypothetical protein